MKPAPDTLSAPASALQPSRLSRKLFDVRWGDVDVKRVKGETHER